MAQKVDPSGIRRGSVLRGVTVRMQCKWPSGAKALEGRVAAVTDDHKGLKMTRTGPPGPGSEVLHRSHASVPRPPPGLLHREPLPVTGHWGWSRCANPRLWVSLLSTPSRGTVHSLCRAHTVITEGKSRCCVACHPRRCVPVRPRQKLSLGKRQDGGGRRELWLFGCTVRPSAGHLGAAQPCSSQREDDPCPAPGRWPWCSWDVLLMTGLCVWVWGHPMCQRRDLRQGRPSDRHQAWRSFQGEHHRSRRLAWPEDQARSHASPGEGSGRLAQLPPGHCVPFPDSTWVLPL